MLFRSIYFIDKIMQMIIFFLTVTFTFGFFNFKNVFFRFLNCLLSAQYETRRSSGFRVGSISEQYNE